MRIERVRRSSSFSSASRLILALALAAAPVGCGGGDSEAKRECEAKAKSAAEAAVVARYYEQGKIGTQAQIEREIAHPKLRFFDASGDMLPYDELSPRAQVVFSEWVALSRAGDVTSDARAQARDAVEPDC
jgi:hypothetical protein